MSTVSAIPGFVTAEEAADIIGVHHSQICRYCTAFAEEGPGEGRLPARKIGNQWLIRREDARKFKRPPVGNPAFQKQ